MNSRGELYGAGVFTTLRTYERKPSLWEKHWRRLEDDAAAIGLDLSQINGPMALRSIDETIPHDQTGTHKVRITLTDERPSAHWAENETVVVPTRLSIVFSRLRPIQRPFRVTVSPHTVNTSSPLTGLKTCNYLEQIRALEHAKANGSSEAVRINERGEIASACMANIFWLKGGELFTPSLETGCLAGTTREFVMENFETREVGEGIDLLKDADAIFLTSAGLGVIQVDEFNGRTMNPVDHPINQLIP